MKYVLYDHPDIAVAAPQTKTVSGSQINSKENAAAVDKAYMKKQAGVTDDMLKDNYYTTEDVQKLTLTSKTENNIITFYYIPYDKATITVNYLDMDGNPIVGQDPDTVIKMWCQHLTRVSTRRLQVIALIEQKMVTVKPSPTLMATMSVRVVITPSTSITRKHYSCR